MLFAFVSSSGEKVFYVTLNDQNVAVTPFFTLTMTDLLFEWQTPPPAAWHYEIPFGFLALLSVSITASLFALIDTCIAIATFDFLHTLPTIAAFCLSLGYYASVIHFFNLRKRGKSSVKIPAPASLRGVINAAVTTILWAVATVFNVERAVRTLGPERDNCVGKVYTGSGYVSCETYYPRGSAQFVTKLSAGFTGVALVTFSAILVSSEIHRRRLGALVQSQGDAAITKSESKSNTA